MKMADTAMPGLILSTKTTTQSKNREKHGVTDSEYGVNKE